MLYDIQTNSASLIQEAIAENKIVRLNNHGIKTKSDLIQFAQSLSALLKWSFGYVNELKQQHKPQNYLYSNQAVPFHWDGAFHISPHLLIFHCIKAPVVESGGQTLFIDSSKMLAEFSEAEIQLLENITLIYQTEKKAHYGGEIRVKPIQRHPITGEKTLRFAEPVETDLNPVSLIIEGADYHQRQSLLDKLRAVLYDPVHCYQHQWRDDELIIADNHGLLHGRQAFSKHSPRYIRRVQVRGRT